MPALARIYAHYVLHSTCTFELEPPSAADMAARFRTVTGRSGPFLVAQCGEAIVGYAYAGPYRDRPAYRHTVESSVYLDPACVGRGIGRQLMGELVRAATGGEFLQMVAVIGDSANHASIRLHESLGFRRVGVLVDVGFKHGKWVDTVLMQRRLCRTCLTDTAS
nr:GNAT family N-acetyltransferase [Ramlibacter aurantiacus]